MRISSLCSPRCGLWVRRSPVSGTGCPGIEAIGTLPNVSFSTQRPDSLHLCVFQQVEMRLHFGVQDIRFGDCLFHSSLVLVAMTGRISAEHLTIGDPIHGRHEAPVVQPFFLADHRASF